MPNPEDLSAEERAKRDVEEVFEAAAPEIKKALKGVRAAVRRQALIHQTEKEG